MNTTTHILSLTIFLIFLPAANADAAYNATEIILLDCGAPSNTKSSDGRSWEADARSRYSSSFNQKNSSYSSVSPVQQDPVPYLSALVIQSEFTFSFPLSPGSKFLRLYFYPQNYSKLDISTSFFSVTANGIILMKNFSAYLTTPATRPKSRYLIKEFIVTVWDNQALNVTFSPSPTSFAFINAIEIVSIPSGLYVSGKDISLVSSIPGATKLLDNTTTLETMYRLNVGGDQIDNMDDTGMFRTWNIDHFATVGWTQVSRNDSIQIKYTQQFPPYMAPKEVYLTATMMSKESALNSKTNITWIFPVDTAFYYLVRLHFCEILFEVTGEGQHLFNIFINYQKAQTQVDVVHLAGGPESATYLDFIIWADEKLGGKLILDLQPVNSTFFDAFLNGLEMFKLNSTDGSLAGPNPDPILPPDSPQISPGGSRNKVNPTIICSTVGAIFGGFALVLLLLTFFICRRKRKLKSSTSFSSKYSTIKTSSTLPSDLCHHFSFAEITAATQNFNEVLLIGKGGFGNVYKGILSDGTTTVAIKRLSSSSGQGAHEFNTEISMLSTLRHLHLVPLLGYCDDNGEMILVYDFMRFGTLRDHLYKTENPPLTWKRRLQICLGAARGLHYLHREAKQGIIHRDVKSSNILLDENFVAKVSDFGLSKMGPTGTSQTHVSTVVKGSFGYLDPEYYRRQHLTEKSDVYSFGVVLFEVLCGRPPMIQGLPKEQVSLAHWARSCHLKGTLDQIVDPYMTGQVSAMALKKFGEVAESCVREHGNDRPLMSDIVWALEFTLELQEAADKNTDGGDAVRTDDEIFSSSSENVAQSKTSNDSSTTISNLSYGAQNSMDSSRYNGVN